MKWYKILALTLMMSSSLSGWAKEKDNNYEESEKLSKSYAVTDDTYVEIENKYGDIEVVTWDKDSIRIDVEMNYQADDWNDIQKLKDLFEIEFVKGSDFVVAKTKWSDDVGILRKGKLEITQGFGNQKLEINYKIQLPKNLELEIVNKFGDVFMGNYSGSLKVEMSYGDFRARSLTNLKELKAGYGKVKIKEVRKGRLTFNSVKPAIIDDVEDVIIQSSGSDIEIESANEVNINSRHDEILFEEISALTGDMTLTDLEVDRLVKNMGTNSKFGSIRIKEIDAGSELINLNGNKTDFRLGFSSFYNGAVEVTVSKELDFMYASNFKIENRGVNSEGNWEGRGKVGENGTSRVMIVAENGFVELEE